MACGHILSKQVPLYVNIAKRYFMCEAHFLCEAAAAASILHIRVSGYFIHCRND